MDLEFIMKVNLKVLEEHISVLFLALVPCAISFLRHCSFLPKGKRITVFTVKRGISQPQNFTGIHITHSQSVLTQRFMLEARKKSIYHGRLWYHSLLR